jgi:hypothetical protein
VWAADRNPHVLTCHVRITVPYVAVFSLDSSGGFAAGSQGLRVHDNDMSGRAEADVAHTIPLPGLFADRQRDRRGDHPREHDPGRRGMARHRRPN